MARSHVNHFSEFPYHITGRTHNREAFHANIEDVWNILSDYLYLAHHRDGLKILAFVLMPNHFHLIAQVSTRPLPEIMCQFMQSTSRCINQISGRQNQTWGGRHYKCEIKSFHYFMNAYKYTYQNPVRARLVRNTEDWKYSTLHALLGKTHSTIPIEEDTLLFNSIEQIEEHLRWLNTPVPDEHNQIMKTGLTKRVFSLPREKNRFAHQLENLRI